MSKPKAMASYPIEYLEIFQAALTSTTPITLHLRSPTEAKALRFDLYGFRSAAVAESYPQGLEFKRLQLSVQDATLIIQPNRAHSAILAALSSLPPPEETLQRSEEFDNFFQGEVDDTVPKEGAKEHLSDTLKSLGFTLGE